MGWRNGGPWDREESTERGWKDERRGVALDVTQVTFFPRIQLPRARVRSGFFWIERDRVEGQYPPQSGGQCVTDERIALTGSNR